MTTPASSYFYKLFVGCKLSSDLKHQLDHHPKWQSVKMDWQMSSNGLKEVYFHQTTYLGKYLPTNQLSIHIFADLEEEIWKILSPFCKDLMRQNFHVYVFPEIFVV